MDARLVAAEREADRVDVFGVVVVEVLPPGTRAQGTGQRRRGRTGQAGGLRREDGVRRLVSGKRVLAAVAFAAAGAYWRELGDEGHAAAAEDAARSCGGDPAAGADSSVPRDDGAQQDAASLDGSGGEGPAAGDQGTLGDPGLGDAGHELASALPVDPGSVAASTKAGVAAKTGMGMTAKVVVGGGLAATVTAGGVVLSQQAGADTVPVRVTVATSVIEATMPGDPEGACSVGGGATDCTRVVKSKKGESGPVSVDPAQPLPEGVSLVYWGCDEGPQADSCTLTADRDRHVCATTTSTEDGAARRRCAELTGSPAPAVEFRPLAWTTRTQVKVLGKPNGRPQVLATTGNRTSPGRVFWSQDATRVAWTETNTADSGDGLADDTTVKLRDLRSGKEHSWTCFACTIAFVDGELVSGGNDIRSHPADGGAAKDHDLSEIPAGPAHDGPPNTRLLNTWSDSGLHTYAVSRVGETGQRSILTTLGSPTKARQVRGLPTLGYANGLWAVSPDGSRAVFDPPTGQPPYDSCGGGAYPMAGLDIASGTSVPLKGPGVGYRVHETWFDPDGTAHVVYRAEKGADAASCAADLGRAPFHYTLAPGANTWKQSAKEPARALAAADGQRIERVTAKGAFSLVISEGQKKRTLDTGVTGVYPSTAQSGESS